MPGAQTNGVSANAHPVVFPTADSGHYFMSIIFRTVVYDFSLVTEIACIL